MTGENALNAPGKRKNELMTTQSFFREHPPGLKYALVQRTPVPSSPNAIHAHYWQDIVLPCQTCKGDRSFASQDSNWGNLPTYVGFQFVTFYCRNCRSEKYTYSLHLQFDANNYQELKLLKVGQVPLFGEPIPDRVLRIAGKERELFLKGKRAENQGMGIAAFAYYRRIVDAHKGKLFEEIIRVANLDPKYAEFAQELVAVSSETQFTKSVDKIKGAIPESLKIQGESPLTLLYTLLSEGLHNESDEECLEIAHDIRAVLSALMEKIETATKDDGEIAAALANLHKRRQAKL